MKPAMTELFEMLSTLTRRIKADEGSPFDSIKSVRKWLKSMPADSDYDAHHALVEGLERFNAENIPATAERLKVLMELEAAGLPLQFRIVEQYVRNQASFRLARQALWRESWVFWSLLAVAWVHMLKHVYKGPAHLELQPMRTEIATRALRYAGLAMRWEYHRSQAPAATAWRRIHKIYRLVERDGYANDSVTLNARQTSCAREYALTVMLGLTNPIGCKTQEIEAIAQLFESYPDLPLPELKLDEGRHTHAIDLSVNEGAFVLDDTFPTGRRLRYLDLTPLIDHLKALDPLPNASGEGGLYRQTANLMERGGMHRGRHRTHRFGRVWVASGMENILAALISPDGAKVRHAMEPWMLRDESTEGMGFSLPDNKGLPHGRLIAVSWNPSENVWQLLAIRWTHEEEGQTQVGTQRLSRHPKRVEISVEPEAAESAKAPTHAVFLPMSTSEQGMSNLLLPQTHYQAGAQMMLRDGDILYRLRLGKVHESHEGWVRVSIDVLGREQVAAAA